MLLQERTHAPDHPAATDTPTAADVADQWRAHDELRSIAEQLATAPRWSAQAERLDVRKRRLIRRIRCWNERFGTFALWHDADERVRTQP